MRLMSQTEREQRDEDWSEARHSEQDAPHEEQEPGSLEEPETVHQPHQGEEGQRDDVA
jgi:hypothetical protein